MKSAKQMRHAIATGRRMAKEVLAHRNKALRRRAATIELMRTQNPPTTANQSLLNSPAALAAPSPGGVLVAEGDSWFDYPFHDVLSELEDAHGFDVESVANRGDAVEQMAYSGGQLADFTRLIDKLLRQGNVPRALLLSGGGNDMAGDEFGMLLNHAVSPIPGLNDKVAKGVIDDRLRAAYVTILTAISDVCTARLGTPLPIILHGYDYPVPDGRGFMGGWGPLPGPWLEPGFREKGFEVLKDRVAEMLKLIDRFNEMVRSLANESVFSHVRYVDLRGTLSTDANYETFWANELHPTPRGFGLIAAKIAAAIP